MRFRRRQEEPFEFDELATYNTEVARGIIHTDEWKQKMEAEQERFNRWAAEKFRTDLPVVVERHD